MLFSHRMRHDRSHTPTSAPAATGGMGTGRASSVQLRKSLRTSSYEEGRAMVSPDSDSPESAVDSPATTDSPTTDSDGSGGAAKPKDKTVILSAKAGGSPFTSEFWTDLDVGHCWVDIRENGRRKDSWGYTASDLWQFPVRQPWKTVEGEVLHPDGSRGATGTLAVDVDEDQLERGEKWGEAAGNKYNLFGLDGGHSCASFAKGFFETATDQEAPTGMFGALIANPNDLSEAMNDKRKEERERNPDAVPDNENEMP